MKPDKLVIGDNHHNWMVTVTRDRFHSVLRLQTNHVHVSFFLASSQHSSKLLEAITAPLQAEYLAQNIVFQPSWLDCEGAVNRKLHTGVCASCIATIFHVFILTGSRELMLQVFISFKSEIKKLKR